MRTRPRNGFTTHTIHATGSRAKLSTKKSIKSIAVDQSRVESSEGPKVESIDRVDRQLSWIDRVARLHRFRGLVLGCDLAISSVGVHYFSFCLNHLQYFFICFVLSPWYFHHSPPYSYFKCLKSPNIFFL